VYLRQRSLAVQLDGAERDREPMGHEFIGVVESIGTDVRTVKKGDLVVAPFRLV
jgi:threonine dehydrogenase-like Zn-dependent dehydrogenase